MMSSQFPPRLSQMVILLLMGWLGSYPVNAQSTGDLTSIVPSEPALQSLLDEASANNPSLQSLRDRLVAARTRVPQSSAWMDPKLGVGAMNLPSDNPMDLNQEPMTGLWINASQSIPLNGKYRSKRAVAEAMVDATRESLDLQAATIHEAVRDAWYDWAYLKESVATVDTTIRLVDELLIVTRTKYETGSGLQSSLLRLQTERSRLSSHRVELEQKARNAGRQLATLLGRDPDSMPTTPMSLPTDFPDVEIMDTDSIVHKAPQVRVSQEMLRARKAKVNLSRQLWVPEMMLGAGYGFRQDADNGMARTDFITVTAGVTLPIFGGSKQGMAVEESIAERRSAEQNLRASILDVNRRFDSLLDEDQRHADQIQLYDEGVLPQAASALSSTLSDYSVGRVGVEALISSERELINARLQRLMHLRDRAKVRASLASLVYQNAGETNDSQYKEN